MTATIKEPRLDGNKLLLVQRAAPDGHPAGEVFVALDTVGAGEDELVVVARGSAGRETCTTRGASVDATVIGIIDSTATGGSFLFRKSGSPSVR